MDRMGKLKPLLGFTSFADTNACAERIKYGGRHETRELFILGGGFPFRAECSVVGMRLAKERAEKRTRRAADGSNSVSPRVTLIKTSRTQ